MNSDESMASSDFDIQGHRGARGLAPENTIPAFLKAVELGVPTLEMDVVISKDEEVVVSHEPWFSREICRLPSGGRIPFYHARGHRIFDMTYDEICGYDVGSLLHPGFPHQKLETAHKPLLRDVIRASNALAAELGRGLPAFSIETKSRKAWEGRYHPTPSRFARLLIAVLEEEGVAHRSIIQSFDPRTLKEARAAAEHIRLSLLVTRRRARRIDANLGAVGFTPEIYSPDQRAVDKQLVRLVHERNMKLIPWTVNDVARMRELKAMGCDGLITDYPDRALKITD